MTIMMVNLQLMDVDYTSNCINTADIKPCKDFSNKFAKGSSCYHKMKLHDNTQPQRPNMICKVITLVWCHILSQMLGEIICNRT